MSEGNSFYGSDYGDMPTDDWTLPVDYEHGTVYLRFEVLSQATTGSQFVNTTGSSFADWWNHPSAPGVCDFTRPEDFYRIGIVLWDQANSCIPMGLDWSSSGCPELQAEFFPTSARVTAVVVAPGETFSGWAAYP